MAKKKPAPILTHAAIGGKKFLLAKDWNETKNVMALIDDSVEVVDSKMRTGVVDIPVELFTGFAWSRHQMDKAIKAVAETGAKVVTLEFLPKQDLAPKAKRSKPAPAVQEAEAAPAAVPEMTVHEAV